jgi:hypothetical protein
MLKIGIAALFLAVGLLSAGAANARENVGTTKSLGKYSAPYSYGWELKRATRTQPRGCYGRPVRHKATVTRSAVR